MKAAVVYLRVSTDRQAERGLSIPAQSEACLAYAQKAGFEVVEEFVDAGESARSADRPRLQDMLTRCRKDKSIKAVIIHKVDRIARNTHDHAMIQVALKHAGVELCSVTENINGTPEGEFLEYIMAAMAQFYSRNLARETLKGMNQRAQNGLWNAPPPLGYLHKQEG
jgi:DNA invertase Pin-like site-specific DNA recombinase